MTEIQRWVLASMLLAAFACSAPSDSAQGAAERFVDQHFVRMDLGAAQQHCLGVAWQKVEEEKRLIGDQQIDASTRKPRVTYKLKQAVPPQGDSSSFVFEGSVQPEGAEEFTREWLVSTRKDTDGTWKVSNFSEFDPAEQRHAD